MIWLTVWTFLRANWKPLAGVLILALLIGWIHHAGYKSGKASGAKELAAMTAKRDQAVAALRVDAERFRQIADAAEANKRALAAQEAAGRDALAQARSKAARDAKALQTAAARQRAAYKGDACAAMPLPEGVE